VGRLDEHKPVLVEEAVAALAVRAGGSYVDATYGRGGHSERILASLGPQGRLAAIDRDPEAIAAGRARVGADARVRLAHGAYGELARLLRLAYPEVAHWDGILIDCGVSSPQLDTARRGFSFQQDGPLDMRMDPGHGAPVSEWLAHADERELARVIRELGEERYARRIAAAIAAARTQAPLTTTLALARVVQDAVPVREPGRHAATRTFQALRIHVNDELRQLRAALEQSLGLLAPGGRLAVISFHSLEDAVVRDFMRERTSVDPRLKSLPVVPPAARAPLQLVGRKQRAGAAEVEANPRARSALLRVAERVAPEAA
jgi:16S rRNA (cytosine1402-N4)-methyltransferase